MRSHRTFYFFAVIVALVFIIVFSMVGVSVLQNSRGYSTTLFLNKPQKAETYAERLIRELYGTGVVFHQEFGDGVNYALRYYCANICVDACTDGSVRYLCDVKAAGEHDQLLLWLLSRENVQILRKEVFDQVEYRYLRSADCNAEIYLNLQTGRVFAAKINFLS